MSPRRQKLLVRVNWYLQSSSKDITELITGKKSYYRGGRYRQVSLYGCTSWVQIPVYVFKFLLTYPHHPTTPHHHTTTPPSHPHTSVSHIYVSVIWVSICSGNGRGYLNQCWVVVNWSRRNKLQWNIDQNSNIFIKRECTRKCRLRNGGHFVWSLQCCVQYPVMMDSDITDSGCIKYVDNHTRSNAHL